MRTKTRKWARSSSAAWEAYTTDTCPEKGTGLHGMEIDMTSTVEEDSATAAAAAAGLSSTARWRQVSSWSCECTVQKANRKERNRKQNLPRWRKRTRRAQERNAGTLGLKQVRARVICARVRRWRDRLGATGRRDAGGGGGAVGGKKRKRKTSSRAKLRIYFRFETTEGKEYFVPVRWQDRMGASRRRWQRRRTECRP